MEHTPVVDDKGIALLCQRHRSRLRGIKRITHRLNADDAGLACGLDKDLIPTHPAMVLDISEKHEQRQLSGHRTAWADQSPLKHRLSDAPYQVVTIDQHCVDVGISDDAPQHKVMWRIAPMSEIRVERKFAKAIDAAIRVGRSVISGCGHQAMR